MPVSASVGRPARGDAARASAVEHLHGGQDDLLEDSVQGMLQELYIAGDADPALKTRKRDRKVQQEQVLRGASLDRRLHYAHELEAAEAANIKYARELR